MSREHRLIRFNDLGPFGKNKLWNKGLSNTNSIITLNERSQPLSFNFLLLTFEYILQTSFPWWSGSEQHKEIGNSIWAEKRRKVNNTTDAFYSVISTLYWGQEYRILGKGLEIRTAEGSPQKSSLVAFFSGKVLKLMSAEIRFSAFLG